MKKFLTRVPVTFCGRRNPPKVSLPDEIYEIVKSCWNEEPEERPSFVEILAAITRKNELSGSGSKPNPE